MIINNILNDEIGYIELQDVMGTDQAVVNAARVSYLGESKGLAKDKKLLQYLWRNKHHTPFEMALFKLKVRCPLFTRSQWFRHRTMSFNEVSRRYTSEDIEFYIPKKLRLQTKDNKQGSSQKTLDEIKETAWLYEIEDLITYCQDVYEGLLANDISRELARMVLPQNMYTTFIVTCDLRNWLHFIKLRSDEHAQWEIRQYSNAIRDTLIKKYFPWTYDEFMKEQA